MRTLVEKTNDLIKERNLQYSPELFDKLFQEIKTNPKNIEEETTRQSFFNNKEFEVSRMTAYGMNKRPY
jgi:hypothetical protein